MNNYPYIIAGLPDYILDFEKKDCDYKALRDSIFELCDPLDCRMIEWLELGFDEGNLCGHFYRACAKCKNSFIKDYFAFDFLLRNEKVAFLGKKSTDAEFEEKESLLKIFQNRNILERERQIDVIIWNKINDLITYEVLSINIILAFLAKARIITRWNRLDRSTGEKLFRQFVTEVNDTYTASKNKTI